MKDILIQKLKGLESYSLTFDYWKSCASRSYLTLTTHFIKDDFKVQDFVLITLEVSNEHIGVNTAKHIKATLEEFDLQALNVKRIWTICDRTSNMKKTSQLLVLHIYIALLIYYTHISSSYDHYGISISEGIEDEDNVWPGHSSKKVELDNPRLSTIFGLSTNNIPINQNSKEKEITG